MNAAENVPMERKVRIPPFFFYMFPPNFSTATVCYTRHIKYEAAIYYHRHNYTHMCKANHIGLHNNALKQLHTE